MCVISKHNVNPSNTCVLYFLDKNSNYNISYTNNISFKEKEGCFMLFPVNGKISKITELDEKSIFKIDNFINNIEKNALYDLFYQENGVYPDEVDCENKVINTHNYKVIIIKLKTPKQFYNDFNDLNIYNDYYESLDDFKKLTAKLVDKNNYSFQDDIYIVCVVAKNNITRGNITITFDKPNSNSLVIAGTLHENIDKDYSNDISIFIDNKILNNMNFKFEDVNTYFREYVNFVPEYKNIYLCNESFLTIYKEKFKSFYTFMNKLFKNDNNVYTNKNDNVCMIKNNNYYFYKNLNNILFYCINNNEINFNIKGTSYHYDNSFGHKYIENINKGVLLCIKDKIKFSPDKNKNFILYPIK